MVINRKENKQKEGMKGMNLMEAVHYAEYLQKCPPYSFHTGKSFQKHLFLHQLTHNMTKDCSW